MPEFTLEPVEVRLGHVFDNDPATPTLIGTLRRSDHGEIDLAFTWRADGDEAARWFLGRVDSSADDSDELLGRSSVPDVLLFLDGDGAAALLYCRLTTAQISIGLAASGVASAQYAVLDVGEFDYRTVTSLRSEIRGALSWFGHGSVKQTINYNEAGSPESLALHLASPEPVPLGRALNVQLRPHFATRRIAAGRMEIHESALIETTVAKPRDLLSHLRVHRDVRDLIASSGWTFLPYEAQWVRRDSDPIRALDGTARGPRWSRLVSSDPPPVSVDRTPPFLFDFATVGKSGFARWLRLRAQFERGINPMMATLDPLNGGLDGCLALSTIGLDGVGYQLALDAGLPASMANRESQADRLMRVARTLTVRPGFEIDSWAQRSADANNGLKHANRTMPNVREMRRAMIENQLIFRLWVAARIGASRTSLERGLRVDPMARYLADD